MNLRVSKLPAPARRGPRAAVGATSSPVGGGDGDAAHMAVREPEDDVRPGAEPPEPGWRSSSYDLKHGLDVVELPTSLPVDVLDRLFNAPAK